ALVAKLAASATRDGPEMATGARARTQTRALPVAPASPVRSGMPRVGATGLSGTPAPAAARVSAGQVAMGQQPAWLPAATLPRARARPGARSRPRAGARPRALPRAPAGLPAIPQPRVHRRVPQRRVLARPGTPARPRTTAQPRPVVRTPAQVLRTGEPGLP